MYKNKKVGGNLPPMPNLEADTQAVMKRKRGKQAADAETPSEEVLKNQAETVAMMMAEEIKLWKGKADTLLMDRKEYEEDLKVVFKMLKEKEELEVKDKEIQKWVVKLANAGRRHAKEMKTLRVDMMIEAAKSVFEARIEMIKEYQAGEHINWNLKEENTALQMIIGEKTGEVTFMAQERIEQAGDAQDSNTE